MGKLRVIQIGVGGFGWSWVKEVAKNPEIEIAAFVDINEDNLQKAMKAVENDSIPVFQDYKEALRSVSADAALVVTPPFTHVPIAMDVLEAGLHVFIEKPLSYSYDEAKQIYANYRKFGKKVMVNQNYRWFQEMQAVKGALDSGLIGEVGYIEWSFRQKQGSKKDTWRQYSPDFLFTDMSIHHFDLMRYFLDEDPAFIQAHALSPSWNWSEGYMTGNITFEFPSGVTAYYFGSMADTGSSTSWNGDIRIVGSKGAIEVFQNGPVFINSDRESEPIPVPEMEYVGQAYSLQNFIESIKNDTIPATDMEDNIKTYTMVHALIESYRKKERVNFNTYLNDVTSGA